MKRRTALRLAALAVWLVFAGWLVRYEAFPEWFTHRLPGYDGLIGRDTLVQDHWMRVLQDGRPVGYTRTAVDTQDDDPLRHISLENRTHLRLEMMGRRQVVQALTTAWLDMTYRLQAFDCTLRADPLDVSVTGTRRDGDTFAVEIRSGDFAPRTVTVAIPDDVVIHAPMTALALRGLRPGRELRMATFNPVTLQREPITLRAVGRGPLTVGGETVEATELSVDAMGTSTRAWIDSDGNLLRQETPFGWTLERCRPEDVFEGQPEAPAGEDAP